MSTRNRHSRPLPPVRRFAVCLLPVVLLATVLLPGRAAAAELFVGGGGDPYATVQAALDAATDGDVVTVRAGTYAGPIETRAAGATLRAEPGASEVVVSAGGRVLTVRHARFTVEGIVLDGQYGADDAVRVTDDGDGFTLRRSEIRNTSRDCLDMGSPEGIVIEGSRIHDCLWATAPDCSSDSCRQDAHGIVGSAVRGVIIRDTVIHTFSGDGVQFDPNRDARGWSDVTIERCLIWLDALPAPTNGFAAGVVPGENAVDTKTSNDVVVPARLVIVDTTARGFRDGLISNMAAFNIKENVEALVDRVTVYDSEIAFRLRGATGSRPRGAQVTLRNVVVFDSDTAVRYEDDITTVRVRNTTFGGSIGLPFQAASAPGGVIEARNLLVLAASLPSEAAGGSNIAVDAAAFVDVAALDYRLADGSPAIDAGEALSDVAVDRDGNPRPQGGGWDVGAYERCDTGCGGGDGGDATTADGVDAAADEGGDAPADDGDIEVPPDGNDGGVPDAVDAPVDAGDDARPGAGGSGGCGCRAAGPRAASWLTLAALAALLRRRRRR